MEIDDEITKVKEEIKKLKREKKEYLLNNSKYIFNYFENKKTISKGNNETKRLDAFFNIQKKEETQKESTDSNIQKYLCNIDETFLDISNFVEKNNVCSKCHK